MSKKRLNADAVTNELKGSSVFFHPRTPEPDEPTPLPTASQFPTPQADQPQNVDPRFHGNMEPSKHISTETRKRGTVAVAASALGQLDQGAVFDLNLLADQKYTLAFTEDELEALDDLKKDLRRNQGIKANKYDLVRCAVHALIEDYRTNPQASMAVVRLRRKRAKG